MGIPAVATARPRWTCRSPMAWLPRHRLCWFRLPTQEDHGAEIWPKTTWWTMTSSTSSALVLRLPTVGQAASTTTLLPAGSRLPPKASATLSAQATGVQGLQLAQTQMFTAPPPSEQASTPLTRMSPRSGAPYPIPAQTPSTGGGSTDSTPPLWRHFKPPQ